MREASHRIMYSVVNSNAMNGIGENSKVSYAMPWYYWILYGIGAVFALLSFLNIRRLVKGVKMRRAIRETAEETADSSTRS